MAEATGTPAATVRRRHHKLGLTPHTRYAASKTVVPVDEWDPIIIEMRTAGETIEAISQRLGITQWPVRKRISKINLERPKEQKLPQAPRRTWSDDDLRIAVAKAENMMTCLELLGLGPYHAGNWKTVKKYIRLHGLDVSHWRQGQDLERRAQPRKRPLAEILVENSDYGVSHLKKRLLSESVKEHRCEGCGLDKWLEVQIPLELDHINGDSHDHRIENLRLLCPNCHALTPTWRGRNIGRIRPLSSAGRASS